MSKQTSVGDSNDAQHIAVPASKGRPRSNSLDFSMSASASSAQSIFNPFMEISPEAAYIAASAAAGIVSTSQAGFFRTIHNDPSIAGANTSITVSPGALRLINQFLDFLLFSFLSKAKSVSLQALRPAVSEVLRARLASEAINGADQELESYLGGDATEIEQDSIEDEWDLQGSWRRTRLRCMVYSSLGDLEDDDEDAYPEYDSPLYDGSSQQQQARVVSPPVAIWLASILEFIGEQALLVAGHATVSRYSASRIATVTSSDPAVLEGSGPQIPSVEELDAEKVALNPSLGRMWRQYRKRTRGPGSISYSARETQNLVSRLVHSSSQQSMTSSASTCVNSSTEGFTTIVSPATPKTDSFSPVVDIVEEDKQTPQEQGEKEESLGKIPENQDPVSDTQTKSCFINGETIEDPDLSSKKRPLSLSLVATFEEVARNVKRPRANSLPAPPKGELAELVSGPSTLTDGKENCRCKERESITALIADDIEQEEECLKRSKERVGGENREPGAKVKVPSRKEFTVVVSIPKPATLVENEYLHVPVRCSCEKDMETDAGTATEEEKKKTDDANIIIHKDTRDAEIHCSAQDASKSREEVPLSNETTQKSDAPRQLSHPKLIIPPQPNLLQTYESVGKSTSLPSITETREESDSGTDFETESRPASETNIYLDTDDEEPETVVAKRVTVRAVSRDVSREREGGTDTPSDSGSSSRRPSEQRLTPPLIVPVTSKSGSSSPTSPHMKRRSSSVSKSSFEQKRAVPGPIAPIAATPQTYSPGEKVRPWTPSESSRRSSSFSKSRPTHTSGSGSSQGSQKVKGFMNWPNESGRTRKSEDGNSWKQNSANADEKERSFEELIQSGGTIHCTITPDPIRNMNPDSPISSIHHDYPRKLSIAKSDVVRPSTGKTVSSQKTNATSIRIPASAARDARVTENSTASLALFLQSTGPPDSVSAPNSAPSRISANSHGAGISKSPRPKTLGDVKTNNMSSVNKARLLPREASGSSTGDSTTYLADFFRNTNPPKPGQTDVQRRINKSVAPFRTTMDSDQFDFEPKEVPANNLHLSSSTSFSTLPKSYQSSTNSTTALLKDTANGTASNVDKIQDNGMPKRNRRPIRDPYAIDFDDDELDEEEDFDLVLPPPPKPRREESLIDFLKNNEPPAPSSPHTPIESPDKAVTKKASNVSLINRLGRSASRKNSISSTLTRTPTSEGLKYTPLIPDQPLPSTSHGLPSSDNTATPPHTPHTMNSSMRTQSFSSSRMAPPVGAARDARVHRSDLDSLADFLKNTGPPPPPAAISEMPPLKSESSFSRLRGLGILRKKRNTSFA